MWCGVGVWVKPSFSSGVQAGVATSGAGGPLEVDKRKGTGDEQQGSSFQDNKSKAALLSH